MIIKTYLIFYYNYTKDIAMPTGWRKVKFQGKRKHNIINDY